MIKKIISFIGIVLVGHMFLPRHPLLANEENLHRDDPQEIVKIFPLSRNPFLPLLPKKIIATSPPIKIPKKIEQPQPVPTLQTKPEPMEKKPPFALVSSQMTITGLIWNSDRPQAIVNGRVVDIGDTISEKVEVVAIRKEGIDVMFEGEQFTLKP